MSAPLISRSPDLQRLDKDGYQIAIKANYLLVLNVPYVNAAREIRRGTLVSELTLAGDRTAPPSNHTVLFAGEQPCHRDGREIEAIKHIVGNQTLAEGLVVQRGFSNKPANGYPDYYEKMTNYVRIISHEAESLDPHATAKTYLAPTPDDDEESVFNYLDTASSRAGIVEVTNKMKGRKVAIVGLGGTGAYVLDLIAKVPLAEIHIFDGDAFLQHNAFRAPGAPTLGELESRPTKVARLGEIYSRMHKRVVMHPYYVDVSNVAELAEMDFVFICIDKNRPKKLIVEALDRAGVAFIDVGMGVELTAEAQLIGIVRVTTATGEKRDHVGKRIAFTDGDDDGEYATNIQIAELNALNAAMAVIKWKKLCGFYQDLERERHATYTLNVNMMLSEDVE